MEENKVTITDGTQAEPSTPKVATEGAVAEMQKVEKMARSVGGDKTSPSLSGKATAPGQKVAAEKHAANEVKQAPQKAAQEAKKASKKK